MRTRFVRPSKCLFAGEAAQLQQKRRNVFVWHTINARQSKQVNGITARQERQCERQPSSAALCIRILLRSFGLWLMSAIVLLQLQTNKNKSFDWFPLIYIVHAKREKESENYLNNLFCSFSSKLRLFPASEILLHHHLLISRLMNEPLQTFSMPSYFCGCKLLYFIRM